MVNENNQQIAVYESDYSCIGSTNINILVSQVLYCRGLDYQNVENWKINTYEHVLILVGVKKL